MGFGPTRKEEGAYIQTSQGIHAIRQDLDKIRDCNIMNGILILDPQHSL